MSAAVVGSPPVRDRKTLHPHPTERHEMTNHARFTPSIEFETTRTVCICGREYRGVDAEQALDRHIDRLRIAVPAGTSDMIANGAIVLQARSAGCDRNPQETVFLCLWSQEFVTWIGEPDGSATLLGHHFGQDLAAALVDYEARR